ncbi:hypothetical protein N7448_011333 [Penicillium atrosanguineum]|nr:hypothetical protein N7448_011333 [Penicillium atrosanguineum]
MVAMSAGNTRTRRKDELDVYYWNLANKTLQIEEEQCRYQRESKSDLLTEDWDALLQSHSKLLSDYLHEVQYAQQLQNFEECAKFLGRMLLNGIQPVLDRLLQKLPEKSEDMIKYIDFACEQMFKIVQPAPKSTANWSECLGRLGYYRAQVGGRTENERPVWRAYSEYHLNQAANISPGCGEIQHYIGKLAYEDEPKQLFHYIKSLVCVSPSETARNTIGLFFDVYRPPSMISAFIGSHRLLFTNKVKEEFSAFTKEFMGLLRQASMFEYGNPDAAMCLAFSMKREPAQGSPLKLSQNAHLGMESLIPWGEIVGFLNNLQKEITVIRKTKHVASRSLEQGATRQLPEDFLIHGQQWSLGYYPPRFFDHASSEAAREGPSEVHQRRLRLSSVGKDIAKCTKRMKFEEGVFYAPDDRLVNGEALDTMDTAPTSLISNKLSRHQLVLVFAYSCLRYSSSPQNDNRAQMTDLLQIKKEDWESPVEPHTATVWNDIHHILAQVDQTSPPPPPSELHQQLVNILFSWTQILRGPPSTDSPNALAKPLRQGTSMVPLCSSLSIFLQSQNRFAPSLDNMTILDMAQQLNKSKLFAGKLSSDTLKAVILSFDDILYGGNRSGTKSTLDRLSGRRVIPIDATAGRKRDSKAIEKNGCTETRPPQKRHIPNFDPKIKFAIKKRPTNKCGFGSANH